jgi:hypothetical protein
LTQHNSNGQLKIVFIDPRCPSLITGPPLINEAIANLNFLITVATAAAFNTGSSSQALELGLADFPLLLALALLTAMRRVRMDEMNFIIVVVESSEGMMILCVDWLILSRYCLYNIKGRMRNNLLFQRSMLRDKLRNRHKQESTEIDA